MSEVLRQFQTDQDLGIFIIPELRAPHKVPLVIALLDASGSMSSPWPHMQASFNGLVGRFKERYGSLDNFLVFPFNELLHEESNKFLQPLDDYPGGGTELFYLAFQKADQIIAAQPLDQPIKIIFMSDGQTDWKQRIETLRGHQGRNTTLLSLGVGSNFPFEAAQKFYQLYHNSKSIPAVFQINNTDEAGFKREFEEIEPYVFENTTRLVLETPQYLYPWSTTKESEVYEGMALICPENSLKLAGLSVPLLAQPREQLGENLKMLEQTWCIKTLMQPGQDTQSKETNSRQAKQALEAISVLEQKFEKVLSDPTQIAELKNPLFRERLQKVADKTFYNLSEHDRANLIDTKAIMETINLDKEARERRREEQRIKIAPIPDVVPELSEDVPVKPAPTTSSTDSSTDSSEFRLGNLKKEELLLLLIIWLILILSSWFPPTRFLMSVFIRFGIISYYGLNVAQTAHEDANSLTNKYLFHTSVAVIGIERLFEPLLFTMCPDWYMISIYLYLAGAGYAYFRPEQTAAFLQTTIDPAWVFVTKQTVKFRTLRIRLLHDKAATA